ncbi:hypothetical protein F9B74_04505 [Pelistega sp. NLN82]|uniref:Uncharacterized protein n=1 Tax=Pelistega ratti TaxID=2652177 RepID=A0A6L9Y552_9BURK|nr:hypothetical protein [Pelistega ratti]NEN75590.1 hypothetical protein [Pelistega ratti]
MMSILAILLCMMAVIALGHLIYESVIAPNKRMLLRTELLLIQIQLKQIDIAELNDNDKAVYHIINESITNLMVRLPNLDLSLIYEMKKQYDGNAKLRERLAKRHQMVLAIKHPTLKALLEHSQTILTTVFKVNIGAWAMWILPLVAISITMSNVQQFTASIMTATAKQIRYFIPSSEIDDELLIS